MTTEHDDNECRILLVRRNGQWFMYEGHQEIDYALGREQVGHLNRDILNDDDLSFLDEPADLTDPNRDLR